MSELKKCWDCKQKLPEEAFSPSRWRSKEHRCRQCVSRYNAAYHKANPEKIKANGAAYRAANVEKVRTGKAEWYAKNRDHAKALMADAALIRLYGITRAERDALIEAQGGGCAYCGRKFGPDCRPEVDHTIDEFGSPVVRGILCGVHNRAFGHFGDCIEGLLKAIEYLQQRTP